MKDKHGEKRKRLSSIKAMKDKNNEEKKETVFHKSDEGQKQGRKERNCLP
jgi:hypothetical protein